MKNDLTNKKIELIKELNELDRRLLLGLWAEEEGWGGVKRVHELTGISKDTIIKGKKELDSGSYKKLKEQGRLRKKGGGRKKLEDKHPEIFEDLDKIMDKNTAGDPMSSLKWTTKSTRNITDELTKKGHKISHMKVYEHLEEKEYSLGANKKSIEGKSHPRRDEQFKHINEKAKEFKLKKEPHISVDCKKKEYIGNFKNPGRIWSEKGHFDQVNVYDFFSLAKGRANPYGVYDIIKNKGFVNVGISYETGEFAVQSINKWWEKQGKQEYPNAKELLICADGGGGNGSRNKAWKYYLQKFSNKTSLKVTVCHYPPGTSKWNKIEHRMFSFISMNWKGKPLRSYAALLSLINATKTKKGLEIEAVIDKNNYEKGKKFSNQKMNNLNIIFNEKLPKWNYTISPQND